MGKKLSVCDQILDAAEAVVAKSGAAHLTLEAVADKAGVSKGGLLYHFPTKEALLEAMIARLVARADQSECGYRHQLGGQPAAHLQAHILAGFEDQPGHRQVAAAVLAAGANDPKMLNPVREWHWRRFQELSASTGNPALVIIIMMALDGLWVNDLLGTFPMPEERRQEMKATLLGWAVSAGNKK